MEASTFYLISSLPSLKTFSPAAPYYGLSPSGLGRGGSVNDYQGKSHIHIGKEYINSKLFNFKATIFGIQKYGCFLLPS